MSVASTAKGGTCIGLVRRVAVIPIGIHNNLDMAVANLGFASVPGMEGLPYSCGERIRTCLVCTIRIAEGVWTI